MEQDTTDGAASPTFNCGLTGIPATVGESIAVYVREGISSTNDTSPGRSSGVSAFEPHFFGTFSERR